MFLFLSIFIISILSFTLFCLYAGLDLIIRSLKQNGLLHIIKISFYIFVAVAITLILVANLSSALQIPDITYNKQDLRS